MPTRGERGTFLPGQSGNPGGRPRVPDEIKEMLTQLTPKAVRALAEALEGEDPKLRLAAATEVLNRNLGKPHQATSIEVAGPNLQALHLQALQDLVEERKRLRLIDHDTSEGGPELQLSALDAESKSDDDRKREL